jgi:hypothetical protein
MAFTHSAGLLLIGLLVIASALNENVSYLGRYNGEAADWPSSGARFNIVAVNSTAKVQININNCVDICNMYVNVMLNCELVQKAQVNPTSPFVTLELTATVGQSYEIQIRKVTESCNGDAHGNLEIGDVSLEGAEFGKVTTHSSKCPKIHKMLAIGDSITAAYGVDGVWPCSFSAATENVDHSYATLVAAAVGAELSVVAWSGMGVVRNYGDPNQMSASPMPDYYNRTISTVPVSSNPEDGNYWQPSRFPADIVLVMLGTNDYSTQPNPTDEQFTSGLVDLLTRIITDYPAAKGHIAAMCAPMQAGNQCANIQQAAQQAGVHYVYITPDTLSGGYGCDGHPNAVTQQNMADIVAPIVQSWL